ncbi:MAG: hypothetical protein Q7S76_03555, partial [bacterium]|nr:hypothetical protein [bacterium]
FSIYRLITPYLPKGRDGFFEEILLSSIGILSAGLYILYIPLKHTQYLIPVSIFVAFFTADFLLLVWKNAVRVRFGILTFCFVTLLATVFLTDTFLSVVTPKGSWTNTDAMAELDRLYETIPLDEFVLDLDGRTLFYKDPYYACCIVFGQFEKFLSRPLPSLPEALERTRTNYIYQGGLERITLLEADDYAYVVAHFAPVEGYDRLWIRTQ